MPALSHQFLPNQHYKRGASKNLADGKHDWTVRLDGVRDREARLDSGWNTWWKNPSGLCGWMECVMEACLKSVLKRECVRRVRLESVL